MLVLRSTDEVRVVGVTSPLLYAMLAAAWASLPRLDRALEHYGEHPLIVAGAATVVVELATE